MVASASYPSTCAGIKTRNKPTSTTDPRGMNLYAYAGNDPVNYVDPMGTCTGSRIKNPDGTCVSTGGYATGSNGVLQGIEISKETANRVAEELGVHIEPKDAVRLGKIVRASYYSAVS